MTEPLNREELKELSATGEWVQVIEDLSARVEELEREWRREIERADEAQAKALKLELEIERLRFEKARADANEMENERLREALEEATSWNLLAGSQPERPTRKDLDPNEPGHRGGAF